MRHDVGNYIILNANVSERVIAADLGSHVRIGVYVPGSSGHRILVVGSAPSTLDAPFFDLTVAYKKALSDATKHAGSFAFPDSVGDGSSTEHDLEISSLTGDRFANAPTVFLIGNLVARDLEALGRTVASVGFEEVGRATTSARAFRERVDGQSALDVIASRAPDLIVLALTDDTKGEGLDYITDLLVGGLSGRESGYTPRIVLLYKGMPDSAILGRLQAALPTVAHQIHGGSPNEPMDLGTPNLAIEDAMRAVYRSSFAGCEIPQAIARAPRVPRASALGAAARELSNNQGLDVAVLSCEHSGVNVVVARGGESEAVRVTSGHDNGRSFHVGLQTPIDRVARWLPDVPLPHAMHAYVLGQTAHPTSVPTSTSELQLAHAIWVAAARDALRASGGGRNPLDDVSIDLAVLTGEVTYTIGRPMQAVLLLINSFEICGVTQLALDASNALAMSGCLLDMDVPVMTESSLMELGVCVALRGQAPFGESAVVVEVHPEGRPTIEREVSSGSMDVVQWEAGLEADVKIWPGSKFDVGLGYGRPAHLRVPITPGSVGLVIDARGRPLSWPDDAEDRHARVEQWCRALNVYAAQRPWPEASSHNG